jgi:hypothetical protein
VLGLVLRTLSGSFVWAVAVLAASPGQAGPVVDGAAKLLDVRVVPTDELVLVELRTEGAPAYRTSVLERPPRLVLDLAATRYKWSGRVGAALPVPITDIRGSQWKPLVSRLVVELAKPTKFRVHTIPDGLLVVLGDGAAKTHAGERSGERSDDRPDAAADGMLSVAAADRALPSHSAAADSMPSVASPHRAPETAWSLAGRVEAGTRHYLRTRGRGPHDDSVLLDGELDVMFRLDDSTRIRFRPRLSIDPVLSSRNRYEPLDAYVEYSRASWSLLAGQMIENWAIVDTFSPADVLNRRDLERNFYDPDPLGELMLRFRHTLPDGGPIRQPALAMYLLPLHRATPLPSNRDRFRLDVTGDNRGDLANGRAVASPELAYAARLSLTWGSADMFLFYFGGPTRIPAFDISPVGDITPVYYLVDMVGFGMQWALGPWLLKAETAYSMTKASGLPRRLHRVVPDSFFQFVVGVDRTFTDLFGKNELTVTLEYAGEDDPGATTISGLRPYKSDVFLGARWQFHDLRRTELKASVVVDARVGEQLWLLDFTTVLHSDLKLVVGGQFVNRAPSRRPDRLTTFNIFPNNSTVHVRLRYDF